MSDEAHFHFYGKVKAGVDGPGQLDYVFTV